MTSSCIVLIGYNRSLALGDRSDVLVHPIVLQGDLCFHRAT
jgi:hypothetical protein